MASSASDLAENDCRPNRNNIGTASVHCFNNDTTVQQNVLMQLNTTNHVHSLSKHIDIYSSHWRGSGRCYRLCCFSSFGIKVTIFLNTIMILLNSGLIIYEVMLIIKDQSVLHAQLPLWYMFCDIIVTIILLIEICFTVGAIYYFNIWKYLQSGWESWVDIMVFFLSAACCAAYYFDLTNANIDNAIMLLVRVIRDIIRIVRCIWFFKMLYMNLIRLESRQNAMASSSFRAEPFLAHSGWNSKYQLQINSSPQSAESDQREYKGPKRVDIYDADDIQRMMKEEDRKLKQRQMYSATPSPPNSKTTTPHSSHKKPKSLRKNLKNALCINAVRDINKEDIYRKDNEERISIQ